MITKNNKGFSFVEMLTIIVIIAIVTLAAYPVILAVLHNSKTKLYKQNVASIERAAKSWAIENADSLPDDMSDARFLTISKLADQGYIKNKYIYDPRNDEVMDGCVLVKKNNQQQYVTEYKEDRCEIVGKDYLPQVKVLSNSSKTYELNSKKDYKYPELEAKTILGEDIDVPKPIIKKNGRVVSKLKNDKLGDKYTLVYKIKDPNNELVATKKFDVEIVDKTDPVIKVLGQTKGFNEEIIVGSDYQIPKAIVTDNSKKKLDVSVSTNLNVKMKGNYEIVYRSIDDSDNMGIFVINVKVIDSKLLEENEIIVSNALVLPGEGKLVKEDNNEYIFKGKNPNNYIKYNNELWRIIKLDQKGIKIVRNNPIKKSVWSSKNTNRFASSMVESELKKYTSLLDKKYLKTDNWDIGYIDINANIKDIKRSESILNIKNEKMAGLINVSDYLNASLDGYNYLNKNDIYWTFQSSNTDKGIYAIRNGEPILLPSVFEADIYPVVYLKGYKILLGTGTINDPYNIKE